MLHFPQQRCFLLLAIPLSMLFSCLLLLQPNGISSHLRGVCQKPHHTGTRHGTIRKALGLRWSFCSCCCSAPLPSHFCCAVLEAPPPTSPSTGTHPLLSPNLSLGGGGSHRLFWGAPLASTGTRTKYKIQRAIPAGLCAQPRHPGSQTDSTGTWDFQSIFQK